MIVGISGLCTDVNGKTRVAGAGKDTVARLLLEKHSFVQLAWADPMKRFCQEVFEFTDEQLWGESESRVRPDPRYVQTAAGALGEIDGAPNPPAPVFLTPRFALQHLGNDWGRACSLETWVRYGLRVMQRLQTGDYTYSQQQGLRPCCVIDCAAMRPKINVVVSDLRYYNEAQGIQRVGGKLVRVKRTVSYAFADQQMDGMHQSEVELPTWGDEQFDYVIENEGDLHLLELLVSQMMAVFSGRVLPYDEALRDVPPFMRQR